MQIHFAKIKNELKMFIFFSIKYKNAKSNKKIKSDCKK